MFWTLLAQANFGGGMQPPVDAFSKGSASDKSGNTAAFNLEHLISNMIGFITVIAGLLFLIYFLSAALAWISSNGEASKVQKARDQIVQGVIGLVVLIMAYVAVGLIGRILGMELLKPGEAIIKLNPL